jgi:hypothetical protein
MTCPDPTLIKANPHTDRVGQPPSSETFGEGPHPSGLSRDSTNMKSDIASLVESTPVTLYDPVSNKS